MSCLRLVAKAFRTALGEGQFQELVVRVIDESREGYRKRHGTGHEAARQMPRLYDCGYPKQWATFWLCNPMKGVRTRCYLEVRKYIVFLFRITSEPRPL